MREIRTYGLTRGCWSVRLCTAGWGLLHRGVKGIVFIVSSTHRDRRVREGRAGGDRPVALSHVGRVVRLVFRVGRLAAQRRQ